MKKDGGGGGGLVLYVNIFEIFSRGVEIFSGGFETFSGGVENFWRWLEIFLGGVGGSEFIREVKKFQGVYEIFKVRTFQEDVHILSGGVEM